MAPPPQSDELAHFIAEHETEIVANWMSAVASQVKLRSIDSTELENSIRLFLRQVARRMVVGRESAPPSAAEHGSQRYEIGFSMAAMVHEYAILMDVVEQLATDHGIELPPDAFRAFTRQIVVGSGEAVLAFVEREREERDRLAARHFAFIAHELRNPLQNLALALGAWDDGFEPAQLRPAIDGAVGMLRELVDGRLVRAQQLAGAAPDPSAQDFDFIALVREIVEDSVPFGQTREIEVTADVPDALEVFQDRSLVWSVLNNLVRNGIKFSRKRGRVIVRVREDGAVVRVEVEDTCGGLADGVAEKMFEPFSQLDSDRTGFGLGLAIARQAIDALGGHMEVRNLEDGCLFSATFPLVLDTPRR